MGHSRGTQCAACSLAEQNISSRAKVQTTWTIFCCWEHRIQDKTIFIVSPYGLNANSIHCSCGNTQLFHKMFYVKRKNKDCCVWKCQKIDLYSYDTNYLEKYWKKKDNKLVIILDIFKYVNWRSLLWKTSDLPSPKSGMFSSSYEVVYHLISKTSDSLSILLKIICMYPTSWQISWEQDPYVIYLMSILVPTFTVANQWLTTIGICLST